MKWNGHTVDESAFDDAWRAFADEDARTEAPPALEERVFAAVRHGSRPPRPASRPTALMAGLSLAATLVLAVGWLVDWRADEAAPALPVISVDTTLRLAPYERTVQAHAAAVLVARDATQREGTPGSDTLPPMLMSLGAAPLTADEPLQLARLRLPREALQALGVVWLGPDVGSVVDIDVLVGEDGLARDIRQVRTVQE